jgi:hypothetical protein
MPEQQSIKDTLDVIRKSLESDDIPLEKKINENVLILNKLVSNDGTIDTIEGKYLDKDEVHTLLNDKLDLVFEKYFTKWLDVNLPKYLEKYFKNKDL